jgi:hypothetical protein
VRSKNVGLAAILAATLLQGPLRAQAPSVTVGGTIYAHFLYQLKDSANHVNNFDIARAYINVNGKFAYGIGARVTPDIFRSADGALSYRLKYAYASWTPKEKSAVTFLLGMMNTPFVGWEEQLWDYRMQGTVAMDRTLYMSSADFGAGFEGNWGYDKLNVHVGLYNGENYNRAPGDKRKDLMSRVSVRLLGTDEGGRTGGLRLTGYAQLGAPNGGGTRQRYIGMLSYRSKVLTLAAELATTKDSVVPAVTTPPTPATPERSGRVISAFGVLRVPNSKVQIIGRVDSHDPNTDADNDRQTRIIAGVAYHMSSNLRVLLDLDHLSYQGTPTPAQEAVRSQALFQIQLVF